MSGVFSPGVAVERKNCVTIDLLRFVLIFYIVLYHRGGTPGPDPALWQVVLSNGYLATSGFIVLSGFILAHSYGARLNTREDDLKFVCRRVARIYPVYILGLVASLPLALDLHYIDLITGTVLYVMMAQSWVPGMAVLVNGPGWTISVLLFCYLLFPCAARCFRPLPRGSLWLWVVLLAAFSINATHTLEETLVRAGSDSFRGDWERFVKTLPLVRMAEFLTGVLAYFLFGQGRRLDRGEWMGLALVASALVPGLCHPWRTSELYLQAHHSLFILPIAAAMVLLFHLDQGQFTFLRHPLMKLLADSSLVIYLIHLPLFQYLSLALDAGLASPKIRWFYFPLLIVLSLAIDHFFAKPLSKLIYGQLYPGLRQRLAKSRKTPPEPAGDPA